MNKKTKKPPVFAVWFLSRMLPESDNPYLSGDFKEVYEDKRRERGIIGAHIWFWGQVVCSTPLFLKESLVRSAIMFRSYLKIALRSFNRNKMYTSISVFGLSLAIAICSLIFLFVKEEFTYDNFHKNKDVIYKVLYVSTNGNRSGIMPVPFALKMKETYQDLAGVTRYSSLSSIISREQRSFHERVHFVDSDFFSMFTFPFLKGDASLAWENPNSIILSTEMAEKYFPDAEPVGKNLTVTLDDLTEQYSVIGVLEKMKENSSLKFDFLLPYFKRPFYEAVKNRWSSFRTSTFIAVEKNASKELLAERVRSVMKQHSQREGSYVIQPLLDIHLDPYVDSAGETVSNPLYSYILSGIGVLILLIASINFMVISIGQSSQRAREIGMRKVMGAHKTQIIKQFFGESILISVGSLVLGMGLAYGFLPVFSELSGKSLNSDLFTDPLTLLALIGFSLLIGLIAGTYPALVISGFSAIETIKNKLRLGGRNGFTKNLLILQYSIAVFLILSTVFMNKQLHFMRNVDLGYNRDHLLVIPTNAGWNEKGARLLEVFRNNAEALPDVVSVTGTSFIFASGSSHEGWNTPDGTNMSAYVYGVDPKFVQTLEFALINGADFGSLTAGSVSNAVIVNEAFVKRYDLSVGDIIQGFSSGPKDPVITGVVKDFNYLSLKNEIAPVVLHTHKSWPIMQIVVRVNASRVPDTIKAIQEIYGVVNPGIPFQYSFLDEDLNQQYQTEEKWAAIIRYAAFLAILISCIGLFGLTSLTVAKRAKEIGIRKVLGSSFVSIIQLIYKEFGMLIIAANIISWPVGYAIIKKWLQNFAYRIDIDVTAFLLSGTIVLIISILTISFQSMRAALKNPVDSIRYE